MLLEVVYGHKYDREQQRSRQLILLLRYSIREFLLFLSVQGFASALLLPRLNLQITFVPGRYSLTVFRCIWTLRSHSCIATLITLGYPTEAQKRSRRGWRKFFKFSFMIGCYQVITQINLINSGTEQTQFRSHLRRMWGKKIVQSPRFA